MYPWLSSPLLTLLANSLSSFMPYLVLCSNHTFNPWTSTKPPSPRSVLLLHQSVPDINFRIHFFPKTKVPFLHLDQKTSLILLLIPEPWIHESSFHEFQIFPTTLPSPPPPPSDLIHPSPNSLSYNLLAWTFFTQASLVQYLNPDVLVQPCLFLPCTML